MTHPTHSPTHSQNGRFTPPIPLAVMDVARLDSGRYLVSVDGEPAGHVHRTRRTWWARALDEPEASSHTTRKDAVARLAAMVATRATVAADTARRMRLRVTPPAGWRFTSWKRVGPGDVIRTPRVCKPVRGSWDDGPLYPEQWDNPVTLTTVEWLHNGCVLARGDDPHTGTPAWLGLGLLLTTPRHVEIGVLVPDNEPTKTTQRAPHPPTAT